MDSMSLDNQNRWSPVTHNDHAGIVWILSILAGVYIFLTLSIRYLIKRKCFGADDWTFLVATITGGATLATTYDALSIGLGKSNFSVTENQLEDTSKALYAGRILLFLTLALSKISVGLLIRRLFAEDMTLRRLVCTIACSCFAAWGVASMMVLSIGCSSSHLVDDEDQKCPGQVARWVAISVIEIVLELASIALSFMVIWGIHINRKMKIKVIGAFAFRAPLIISSILNVVYISSLVKSSNPNLGIVPAISVQTVHLALSLFTATVPNLKSFLMSFDTGQMMVLSARERGESAYDNEGSGSHSHGSNKSASRGGTYPLRPVNNPPTGLGHSTFRQDPVSQAPPPNIRGGVGMYDRKQRNALTESFYSDDDEGMKIVPVKRPNYVRPPAATGRDRSDDEDDGSREAPSFGAESQRRIWRRPPSPH